MLRAVAANTSGTTMLKTLGAAVSGIANSETIFMQAALAAGQWRPNGIIRIRFTASKSGTTDAANLTIRVGTAGTTGDTAITGFGPLQVMATTGRSGGFEFDVALVSDTSAMKVGSMSNGVSSYGGQSSVAQVAATTISDAATNALYFSVAINSAGTTDTVTVNTGSIAMVNP